jgi:hypothetical protein
MHFGCDQRAQPIAISTQPTSSQQVCPPHRRHGFGTVATRPLYVSGTPGAPALRGYVLSVFCFCLAELKISGCVTNRCIHAIGLYLVAVVQLG